MPPKLKQPISNVNFDLEAIRPFLTLIPTLNHSIQIHGIELPSPITHYLKTERLKNDFEPITELDLYLRNNSTVFTCDYQILMKYINALIDAVTFIIETYDLPFLAHIRNLPKSDYIKGYASLLRCQLDRHFDYIRAMQDKKRTSNLKPAEFNQVNAKINLAYRSIADTTENAKKFFDQTDPAHLNELSIDFKFRFYQAYIETLIFKSQILDYKTQNQLKSLPTDYCLAQMEKSLENIRNPGLAIDFHLINSRIALRIHRNLQLAHEQLALAKDTLKKLALNVNFPIELVHEYNNHIILVELSIFSDTFDSEQNNLPPLSFLNEAGQAALAISESIHVASNKHKTEISFVVQRIIEASITQHKQAIQFSKLEQLSGFTDSINQLKQLIQLIHLSATKEKSEIAKSFAANYDTSIDSLLKLIKFREVSIKVAMEKSEKDFDELAKKEAQYDANFQKMLAQFETERKESVTKRPKMITYYIAPLPSLPTTNEISPPETPAPSPITVATHASAYFANTGIDQVEGLLQTVKDEDHAEALLYIGDEYLKRGYIMLALGAYERAFQQTQLKLTEDTCVLEAIIMQLDHTKSLITKRIRHAEIHQQVLKQTREQYIINLGINALKIEGASDKDLNLKKQSCWDKIYERGNQEFIAIGMRKREAGKSLSEATMTQKEIAHTLSELKSALHHSNLIIGRVQASRNKANFPALSSHSSALFQNSAAEMVSPSMECKKNKMRLK